MKASARPYHHGNLREALLEKAEKALEHGGAGSISLRELSRELGVSHTSPRRHFADRQALLYALAVRGFERFDAVLGRAIGHKGGFKGRLTRLARAYVAFAQKSPALLDLMFDSKHRPDAPPELLAISDRAFSHARTLFAEGQAAREVVPGDPARLSVVVFAALLGLITLSTDGKFKGISLDRLTGEIIDRLILGYRPRKS
jgi:AcrR family transcriptional regulator